MSFLRGTWQPGTQMKPVAAVSWTSRPVLDPDESVEVIDVAANRAA
jgi:hypothetical protein